MDFEHVFNELKDENEIVIVKKYNRITKYYTVMLTSKTLFIDFYI